MGETGKQMWERRARRVDRLKSVGYCSAVLSHMTDEEVMRSYEIEKEKRKRKKETER